MRTAKYWAIAALIGVAWVIPSVAEAGPIPPEFANWFTTLPTFTTDTFTIIVKGDQRASIPTQNATDSQTNPFALASPGSAAVNVGLDKNGNTDIVYTGSPIVPGTTFPYPNTEPHFGLNGGSQPQGGLQILSMAWSNSGQPTNLLTLPVVSISTSPTNIPGPTFNFLTLFLQAGVTGEWFEVPYQPGQLPAIQIANDTASPFTLSNAGFFLSTTEIPLDNLNFNSLPPPGSPGSPFTMLPSLNGLTLAPGASINASVPEPATLVALGQGLLVVVGFQSYRARRKRSATPKP